MRVPTRCKVGACRTRRTLPKPPEQYDRWPTCKVCGADLTVDKHRQNRGANDRAPVCYDQQCRPYPHRKDDKACRHGDDWRSGLRPVSGEEAPF